MKTFSLSPAVIAVLVAGSSSPCLAQTSKAKSLNGKTMIAKQTRKGEGSTNVGGITMENGEGSTNTGGYTFEAREGGTNVGGSEDGINFVANPWDTGVIRIMERAKRSAAYNFADNKTDTAIKMLELQLEAVVQDANKYPDLNLSWTKKVANRTLEMAGRLEAEIKNPDDRVALFNVYLTAYDVIMDFYKMDMNYIIPYNKNKGVKGYVPDTSGMEYEMKRYIVTQGNWFTKRFITWTEEYGYSPKYTPRVVLVALSTLTKGLSQDLLNGNIFPHAFEATSSQLLQISNDIENHLDGGDVFGGPTRHDRAINDSYKALMGVVDSVK